MLLAERMENWNHFKRFGVDWEKKLAQYLMKEIQYCNSELVFAKCKLGDHESNLPPNKLTNQKLPWYMKMAPSLVPRCIKMTEASCKWEPLCPLISDTSKREQSNFQFCSKMNFKCKKIREYKCPFIDWYWADEVHNCEVPQQLCSQKKNDFSTQWMPPTYSGQLLSRQLKVFIKDQL